MYYIQRYLFTFIHGSSFVYQTQSIQLLECKPKLGNFNPGKHLAMCTRVFHVKLENFNPPWQWDQNYALFFAMCQGFNWAGVQVEHLNSKKTISRLHCLCAVHEGDAVDIRAMISQNTLRTFPREHSKNQLPFERFSKTKQLPYFLLQTHGPKRMRSKTGFTYFVCTQSIAKLVSIHQIHKNAGDSIFFYIHLN